VRRAVALGILDEVDEQPYFDVRLGRRAIEPIAVRLGVSVDAMRMCLGPIEPRIADALAAGLGWLNRDGHNWPHRQSRRSYMT
jgi:hypothetical protein